MCENVNWIRLVQDNIEWRLCE